MKKKRKWTVYSIDASGEGLASCKTEVSASSAGAARKKIETNNIMVTWVQRWEPERQKKSH